MELSNYILVSRNNVVYKAKLSSLSSIIVLDGQRESFLRYLDDISASIDSLTTSFDIVLYPKSEMKADFTIKESVSSLTADGKYVLTGDAKATADGVKSKEDLDSWYETQSYRSVNDVLAGYDHAVGILKDDTDPERATEYGLTPTYEDIMSKYTDADL